MRTRNSRGPSTDPWGTPDFTSVGSLLAPFTSIACFRWVKNAWFGHENPQLDSAVRQIREVGGPGSGLVWTDGGEADGWGGGRTLGWPKVAL